MKNAEYHTRKVKNCCENKLGIEFRKGRSKEHNGWFKLKDGKKAVRITVPKGKKPIPPKTYKSMAKQLMLEVEEFDELLECTLKLEGYQEILNKQLKK
jgi:hypothetical protein